MTGAMYAAISGMKSHMNKLNVIGNNIANVNTVGFKSGRMTFTDSLYTSMRSGSNGSANSGGVNPSQIGYGCNVGSIDLDMSTKTYMPTGRNLDCMIDGDGFFFVGPKPDQVAGTGGGANAGYTYNVTDPQNLNLTRVGTFKFDSDGYLVDEGGSVVYGFVTCASGTAGGKSATAGTADKDNLQFSTQLVPIRLPLLGKGDATQNPPVPAGQAIFPGVDANGQNVYDDGALSSGESIVFGSGAIQIDGATGKITATSDEAGTVVVGYIPLAKVANPNGVTHLQGAYYAAGEGAGSCSVGFVGGSKDPIYMNNATAPGTEDQIFSTGKTSIIEGGLEMSGTDLAVEFSEMISTQRGYQANTRIINVTDSMLEELVNIKR